MPIRPDVIISVPPATPTNLGGVGACEYACLDGRKSNERGVWSRCSAFSSAAAAAASAAPSPPQTLRPSPSSSARPPRSPSRPSRTRPSRAGRWASSRWWWWWTPAETSSRAPPRSWPWGSTACRRTARRRAPPTACRPGCRTRGRRLPRWRTRWWRRRGPCRRRGPRRRRPCWAGRRGCRQTGRSPSATSGWTGPGAGSRCTSLRWARRARRGSVCAWGGVGLGKGKRGGGRETPSFLLSRRQGFPARWERTQRDPFRGHRGCEGPRPAETHGWVEGQREGQETH